MMSDDEEKLQVQKKIKMWLITIISVPVVLIGWVALNLLTKLAYGKLVEEGGGAAPLILGILFFFGMSILLRIFWLKAPKGLRNAIDRFSVSLAAKYVKLKSRPKAIGTKLETPIIIIGLVLFALSGIFGFLLGRDNGIGERITGVIFIVIAIAVFFLIFKPKKK